MEHYSPYPAPKDKIPLYINAPWLIDESSGRELGDNREPESEDDNIRVFIPMVHCLKNFVMVLKLRFSEN